LGVGREANNPITLKNIVTKSEDNEAGRIHEAVHEGLRVRTRNKLELNIDTWNVRSLYRAGALKTVINQFSAYKADTVALQEMRGRGRRKETGL
jgi:hypothetical protein